MSNSFRLEAKDGLSLQVYAWLPEQPARAIVQIAHGMSEHALRYAGFAASLVDAGYAVYAHDQRGHGASLQPGATLGHMADEDAWNLAVDDLHRIAVELHQRHPDLPLVSFGHSMGSFMVQQLLIEHPEDLDAAILSASNGRPPPIAAAGRGVARLERARLGKTGRSALLNKLSFEDFNKRFAPNRTAFDWLSRDEREVDAYIEDPRCGEKISVQSWVDMLDALPKLTEPAALARIPKDKPIYLFAGRRDPVGAMGAGVMNLLHSYRAAWLTRVSHKLYPGGRHEMLHETNRDEVVRDILAWLDTVASKSSAAA
jgi:alpha-beta hydrolase superfamily lysophospholipase